MEKPGIENDARISELEARSDALLKKSRRLQNRCAEQSDHVKELEEQSELLLAKSKDSIQQMSAKKRVAH